MPLPTLKELKSESERLKQMLGWIMDENAGLKYRLSEVLKEKFDDKMLIKVEDYQSYFIQEDELIGLLRNDIALLDKKMLAIAIDDKKSIKFRGGNGINNFDFASNFMFYFRAIANSSLYLIIKFIFCS